MASLPAGPGVPAALLGTGTGAAGRPGVRRMRYSATARADAPSSTSPTVETRRLARATTAAAGAGSTRVSAAVSTASRTPIPSGMNTAAMPSEVASVNAPTHTMSERDGDALIATASGHTCSPVTVQDRLCQTIASRTPRTDAALAAAGRRSNRSSSAAPRLTSCGRTRTTAISTAAPASHAACAPSSCTPASSPTVNPLSSTRLMTSAAVVIRRPNVMPLEVATLAVASMPGTRPGRYLDRKPMKKTRTTRGSPTGGPSSSRTTRQARNPSDSPATLASSEQPSRRLISPAARRVNRTPTTLQSSRDRLHPIAATTATVNTAATARQNPRGRCGSRTGLTRGPPPTAAGPGRR
ncbi:Predicted cell-wall-anchored protein SasA (LPXTG motif) [[Actinomadura] parvosata subsp. kistnae]|nr:Predicted cell-wall-anchored protein SasA (LPXTG motif) [Actinomadura parvosata subsp. kistnae]